MQSKIDSGTVDVQISYPRNAFAAETVLRLRMPGNAKIKSVALDGVDWTSFDAERETITIPSGKTGTVKIHVSY